MSENRDVKGTKILLLKKVNVDVIIFERPPLKMDIEPTNISLLLPVVNASLISRVRQSTTQSINFRNYNTPATHFAEFGRLLYKKYSTQKAFSTPILYSGYFYPDTLLKYEFPILCSTLLISAYTLYFRHFHLFFLDHFSFLCSSLGESSKSGKIFTYHLSTQR